jgi:hypothetical protein
MESSIEHCSYMLFADCGLGTTAGCVYVRLTLKKPYLHSLSSLQRSLHHSVSCFTVTFGAEKWMSQPLSHRWPIDMRECWKWWGDMCFPTSDRQS